MKKILALLTICILLGGMPMVTAVSIPQEKVVNNQVKNRLSAPEPYAPMEGDWTGEFVGAFGNLKKVDGEWNFTKWGYLAGGYKGGKREKFAGNLYDLNETKFGTIYGYYGHNLLLGKIKIGGKKAPIIGFLLHNENMFIGRIMSFLGPAPHIIGYHQAS